MVHEVEREVKFALATREDYERLRRFLHDDTQIELKAAILQMNRFYDDHDVLRDAGAVLRMRKMLIIPADLLDIFTLMGLLASPDDAPKTSVEFTLKQKLVKTGAEQEGLRESNEWTVPLHELWDYCAEGLDPLLPGWFSNLPAATWQLIDDRTFRKWGEFTNHRYEYAGQQGELVCLDRTFMFEDVDYELEIETPDPLATKTYWSSILDVHGIGWTWQNAGKARRLRRRLDERKAAAL